MPGYPPAQKPILLLLSHDDVRVDENILPHWLRIHSPKKGVGYLILLSGYIVDVLDGFITHQLRIHNILYTSLASAHPCQEQINSDLGNAAWRGGAASDGTEKRVISAVKRFIPKKLVQETKNMGFLLSFMEHLTS